MKTNKYRALYEKWAKTGKIENRAEDDTAGSGGLCNTVIGKEALKLFEPTQDEIDISAYHYALPAYWGYDGKDYRGKINIDYDRLRYRFTPLRQNIVLLLAEMEDDENRS